MHCKSVNYTIKRIDIVSERVENVSLKNRYCQL